MSLLIPKQTVDLLRTFNNISIGMFGIKCDLYVANNLTAQESDDIYLSPSNLIFTEYLDQDIWIEWKPDQVRLRKLGIFNENNLPILAWFSNTVELTLRSYIKVPERYIPNTFDTDYFEISNIMLKNPYDSEIYRCYSLTPLRNKQ